MTNEKYGMVCGKFTCNGNDDNCGREYSLSGGQVLDWEPWNSKPFFASYATVQSAKAAYKDVLSADGTASVNLQPFGCGIYLVNVRGIDDGIKLNKTIKVMRR
ncbi:MAG: hypothetical protein IJ177_07715 [Fibrobacter sp.]|uniref:hypothetical protein n=1 Tax=Fibrobacter sp. TaxID=35828 RepID=UPI0025BFCD45|nr:hypothetical protein [Fibrobacter sp.]MBQ9226058.1 hypothetical protein [Fibrobacter sp.]